jgi:hypothetical protein
MNARRPNDTDRLRPAVKEADEQASQRPAFTSLERTNVRGVGLLVSVPLDQDTDDFSHLVGKKIVIDGRLETCFSVDRFNHLPPWRAGERIGLCIRRVKAPRRLA